MKLLTSAILLVVAGCAPAPSAGGSTPTAVQGECDATKAQALIGREASTELATEAQRLSGANAVRWLRPGQPITMDFRVDRLNIEIDTQNHVLSIRCG